jgi:hypothetical protein
VDGGGTLEKGGFERAHLGLERGELGGELFELAGIEDLHGAVWILRLPDYEVIKAGAVTAVRVVRCY